MSTRWSSAECVTIMEHRDLQAQTMAIDNTGTYVLLAGRRYIALRNLDDSDHDMNVWKFPRQSKYEVTTAEWNPTTHKSELCVISCNQRLEVLTWTKSQLIENSVLRAHTRSITDLNWHRKDPNILASCSADTFIHIWDLRDTKRPSLSLSAIAEASQVRWNYFQDHILATSHDGDIKLWDNRKGTAPILYITAHLNKIYGLDWHPTVETQLATSSQDNTVKFFDTNNARRPEFMLTTNAPVWRARYTPFGNGLVTVVVPQLRRGENSLLLWNTANPATPVHTFVGHKDVVLEFGWRKQKPGDRDFQLVTWSKDQTLLIWKIEPFLQKLCGYEPEDSKEDLTIQDELDTTSVISSKTNIPQVQSLTLEFSLLNININNLEVFKMDIERRLCMARATTNTFYATIQITFPGAYPAGVPPIFKILPENNLDEIIKQQVVHTLTHVATQRVLKNRTCLEPCLRQFASMLEQRTSEKNNFTSEQNAKMFGNFNDNDSYIPFPRTTGAKFSSVGTLVCFGRSFVTNKKSLNNPNSTNSNNINKNCENATPRALSALGNIFLNYKSTGAVSVSSYYYQNKSKPKNKLQLTKINIKPTVLIYDVSELFYLNRTLGLMYSLAGSSANICKFNANAAYNVSRMDLVQAWKLAELVSSPDNEENEFDCTKHPLFSGLLQSLIDHYAAQQDIQMAAMLSCLIGKGKDASSSRKSSLKNLLTQTQLAPGKKWFKTGGSPYHTIPPADVVADGWVFPLLKNARSSSLDNLRIEESTLAVEKINPTSPSLHEYYKTAYAEVLYRWGLLYNRAEVLKHLKTPGEVHKGVEFLPECNNCKIPTRGANCQNCKSMTLNCVICHISVRGSANSCIVCGHGGHTQHLQEWFSQNNVCPTGCGCYCLVETKGHFAP